MHEATLRLFVVALFDRVGEVAVAVGVGAAARLRIQCVLPVDTDGLRQRGDQGHGEMRRGRINAVLLHRVYRLPGAAEGVGEQVAERFDHQLDPARRGERPQLVCHHLRGVRMAGAGGAGVDGQTPGLRFGFSVGLTFPYLGLFVNAHRLILSSVRPCPVVLPMLS